jgi:Tol biopolymer transport system component/DNA-binding winged helix-turn-helix (wHTH) protein
MSSGGSSINSQQNLTAPNPNNTCIYEFEDFRLDASHLMLYKNGTTVSLKPKVVETLIALIERCGEVIGKDELMKRLWPDSFVEEANLSQNIYLLRKTLGNCAGGQPLIETFWRRGYRFNGTVRQSGDVELLFATHTKTLVVTEEETIEDRSERNSVSEINQRMDGKFITRNLIPIPRLKSLSAKFLIGAVALICGSLLIFSAVRPFQFALKTSPQNNTNSAGLFSVIKIKRLTPDLNILSAAISPDGKYLAYDLVENEKHSLWVKDITSGGASRIGPPMGYAYFDLSFGPDGAQIYYNTAQKNHPNRTIFRVPAVGGEPQEIAYDAVSPVTFSPDHRRIAFIRARPGESTSLIIANADGSGGEQELRSRSGGAWFEGWGSSLSWSPDGTRIVVCGGNFVDGRRRYELTEISVADRSDRVIATRNWNYLDEVMWLSDQSGLVVRARETQVSPWQIWHVSYPEGKTSRITNDLNDYDGLSLAANSRVLAVTMAKGNWNLWSARLEDTRAAKQITSSSTASDGAYGIAFTRDGRILYTSPRDGNVDLWSSNLDGSEQHQLTKNAGEFNGAPRVTHDDRFIVFVSSRSGSRQIWRMDTDGGNPVQLTHSHAANLPSLSPDGRWVYFTLVDGEKHMIAKISIEGGEPATVKPLRSPVFAGPISPNGALMEIGFYDDTSAQPWKHGVMSLSSGEIMAVFDGIQVVEGWTEDSKSLIVLHVMNRSNLWLQPIDGAEPRQLTKFDGGMIRSFAVSPGGKEIAISRGNPSAEAILISNF